MVNRNKWVVLGIFIVAVSVAVMLQVFSANGQEQPKGINPPQKTSDVGEFRGITLQLHNGDENHPYETYIDEIAQTGANTLSLVVTGYQENGASASIFVDLRKTPGDERLKHLIGYAHSKGLCVILMPVVLLENAREGEWRGKIAPTDWDHWWEDYISFLMRYAKIAEQANAEVFLVGSELVSTEKFTERWRELIRQVREIYSGRLCYSANWDHYRPVEWWDDLDIVGMTSYYDLTGGKEPTLERLVEAWKPIKKDILTWQATINRPLLFTEVGWPNQATCAQYPWDYYRSADRPDPQAQANCFEAFFQTWIGEKAVAGFLVWEWRNNPAQPMGLEDPSYVPAGKPAMDVIRKVFRMPAAQAQQEHP